MSPRSAAETNARPYNCEALEERLALTVQALSDLPELIQFSGLEDTTPLQTFTGVSDPSQHIDYVRDNYSFDGTGQTVAVIDSGIAWDHYALGGGLGKDFRVVGGWDFAENDANPYDDGPAGFHGTHVAGIVGSSDSNNEGVASGVDLVGLRVFDDMGGGKLEWVEQALRWVHEHRNDFEHPITTVNLSIGVDWNADTIPGWATLEDEFAQLKKDGIFISVAAGNSFAKYLSEGLSYPAASSHVVPVSSHGSSGNLSDFSQRNDRVLVAPGENINSTIPAHIYGQSGPSNKFMATSGTSMAAPYVAGASTLLREAFELAGTKGISQELIYQHFQETADEVYDTVTRSWYSRLNLAEAIDAALEDGHGDSQSRATQLGKISKLGSFDGILAKHNDVDYFRFAADESGQVTLTLDDSHDLSAVLNVVGQNVIRNGNQISFDVTAGQEYFVRLHGGSGQGSYDVEVQFESSMAGLTDLGIVRSNQFENLSGQGESFYKVTAARNAILTIEALFGGSSGNLSFEVYNDNEQLVASSSANSQGARSDFQASAGQSFIIKVIGNSDSFDLKLTNLVRTVGTRVIVGGTGQADTYSYASQTHHQIQVNGTDYEFDKSDFDKVRINGGTGNDTVELVGSTQKETLSGGNGRVVFYGSQTDVIANSFESIRVHGNGGDDLAVINDSKSADFFRGSQTVSELTGGGYYLAANDFDRVTIISSRGGNDRAELTGSSGDDFLHIHQGGTSLGGAGFQNYVIGFESVRADGQAGHDNVIARGTSASETLTIDASGLTYQNEQGRQAFENFTDVVVKSGGGNDQAMIAGLRSGDQLTRNLNDVQGSIFGQDLLIENYKDVDWSAEVGQSPDVTLSAIEEIFDDYSNE